jgi:hypothetical protein
MGFDAFCQFNRFLSTTFLSAETIAFIVYKFPNSAVFTDFKLLRGQRI